jgi:hypothetical protein
VVRKILLILAGTAVIGTSGGASMGLPTQHARELMAGILDDVGSILSSFAGGPDDPKSPVVNPTTLNTDSARLDAATRKAEQLATELGKLRNTER